MTTSQTDAILALLRERGEQGLTPLEALDEVRCFRLAARISDAKALLRDDEVIVTERVTRGGKSYARYVLRRREPTAVQVALFFS